jgi:hypothetical protein
MKKQDQSTDTFVSRRLSQLKILSRLMEHELAGSKPGPSLTMDRAIAEDLLDLLEVFVEEVESKTKPRGEREVVQTGEAKATVTRLN